MILNWNQKDSDYIHVDPNYTNSNEPIPDYLTNIRPIHNLTTICVIESLLALLVHFPVHTSTIFIYGIASDPLSPSHESSSENLTHKGNPKPCNNPTDPLPYIPDDPDSDPSLSDSSL